MKVMIGTPTHSGACTTNFVESMFEFAQLSALAKIDVQWQTLSFCSFPHSARERIARKFMDGGFTDLVFIDDDIGFDPIGVMKVLLQDADVIGIPCPRRSGEGKLVVNPLRDGAGNPIMSGELMECAYVGTGIMRIRRSALERMEVGGCEHYFDAGWEGDDFIGEDAWFCREFRRLGGRVWAMPGIKTTHAGQKVWHGDLAFH